MICLKVKNILLNDISNLEIICSKLKGLYSISK